MKELPLLMQPDMAIATWQDKKIVTRRTRGLEVINQNPDDWDWQWEDDKNGNVFFEKQTKNGSWLSTKVKSPYGMEGDRLWVRENIKLIGWDAEGNWLIQYMSSPEKENSRWIEGGLFPDEPEKETNLLWALSDYLTDKDCPTNEDGDFVELDKYMPVRPSIHMPKAAARLWLEVVDIYPARLHAITGADCIREGLSASLIDAPLAIADPKSPARFLPDGFFGKQSPTMPIEQRNEWLLRAHFLHLIDEINGFGTAAKNPWVWRVEFKVISKNGRPKGIR